MIPSSLFQTNKNEDLKLRGIEYRMYVVRLNMIVHKETKLVHEISPITCWLKRAV